MEWLVNSVGNMCYNIVQTVQINAVLVGFFGKQEALSMIEREDFRNEVEKCLDFDVHPFYIES